MNILLILEHYRYLIIFPIVIVEGPIITIVSGFLVYLGFLDALWVFPLLVFGDLVGDSFYYWIGKYGTHLAWMQKLLKFFGYNREKEKLLQDHFKNHTIKTLLIAKISHGLGIPVQISAGMSGVKFSKYVAVELLGTLPKTLILLVMGFYLGDSYDDINNYLHAWAFILLAALGLAILYLLAKKYSKKLL